MAAHPRLRRLPILLLARVVGFAGSWLGLILLSGRNVEMGPFRVRLTAVYGRGLTDIDLPPLGRITANTHRGPLRFTATLQEVSLPDLTRDELLHQVDATNAALTRVVGESTVLVRPPYGARTPAALGWLAGHGMTTVLWDIDTTDWAAPGTDTVVTEARRASDGSVVLMHDAGGDRTQTVEALPRILEHLLERDYRFVTIDQLSRPRPGA